MAVEHHLAAGIRLELLSAQHHAAIDQAAAEQQPSALGVDPELLPLAALAAVEVETLAIAAPAGTAPVTAAFPRRPEPRQ